jgi:hypothetical protein
VLSKSDATRRCILLTVGRGGGRLIEVVLIRAENGARGARRFISDVRCAPDFWNSNADRSTW